MVTVVVLFKVNEKVESLPGVPEFQEQGLIPEATILTLDPLQRLSGAVTVNLGAPIITSEVSLVHCVISSLTIKMYVPGSRFGKELMAVKLLPLSFENCQFVVPEPPLASSVTDPFKEGHSWLMCDGTAILGTE